MNFKRLWAMIKARNYEFFRDRAAFGWNFLFPFLIIAGFAIIFGGDDHKDFKVGIFPCPTSGAAVADDCVPVKLGAIRQIQYVPFENLDDGLEKLKHHKIDLLLEQSGPPYRYWINDTAPKGYVVEKMFIGSLTDDADRYMVRQQVIASTGFFQVSSA
jgi:ABC-2 type transport system permease protein